MTTTTTTITNDTDCADCTAIAVLRTCAGCGAEAMITDCGHQSQPRPIAANGVYGTEASCESCEDAQEGNTLGMPTKAPEYSALVDRVIYGIPRPSGRGRFAAGEDVSDVLDSPVEALTLALAVLDQAVHPGAKVRKAIRLLELVLREEQDALVGLLDSSGDEPTVYARAL